MAALTGIRVLDMTQYEAGTSCTQYLAWLGAEIIKIESPNGDPGRNAGINLAGDSQYFMNYNSGKKSVVIDLKNASGRQLLLDLAKKCDIFVENYGPGVMESLNIGPDILAEINHKLIYGRIKGFGLSGPYAKYNAYDWVAQASAGSFSVTGDPLGPPQIVGPTIGDSGTGIQMALGILAAYIESERTGLGQMIEISMQEAVAIFMKTLDLLTWGKEPAQRYGTKRGRTGGGLYRCKGEGTNDYVMVFPVTLKQQDTVFTVIEKPELLADPRFSTLEDRVENESALREIIQEWALEHTKQEAMTLLAEAGVPASYVFDTLDLFTDPHLMERNFIVDVEHPVNGSVQLMRHPLRMPGALEPTRSPILGEHTQEVLKDYLGLDTTQISELISRNVIKKNDD
jgi:formyl-CoA transferase